LLPVERRRNVAAPRNVIHSAAPAISPPLLIREPAMNISSANLKAMSFDKLSKLRDQVDTILSAKVAEEYRAAQSRLKELDRLALNGARASGAGRGSRGAVPPKYRNLENPAETWAGRGLKPRWLAAALKSGKKLEDFSIEASKKGPRAGRRKAAKH
jgi:DNA-binding protein H-NS